MTGVARTVVFHDTGDFLLLRCPPSLRDRVADRLASVVVRGSGARKFAAQVHALGSDHVVTTWGRATLLQDGDACLVGIIQADGGSSGKVATALSALSPDAPDLRKTFDALSSSNYALGSCNRRTGDFLAATDAFRRIPLYSARGEEWLAVATDARLLAATGLFDTELDVESLYHYLNFAVVPAPHSIFRNVRKLPAATLLQAGRDGITETAYWRPRFTESESAGAGELVTELRRRLDETVGRYRPGDETHWGAFLSGGTDSSSIVGILARQVAPEPVNTFSIGFEERGYDELEYADIAARHFSARAHVRRVSEDDAVQSVEELLRVYDEPYGNASAIPTLYCTREAAAHSIQYLVAGDGGDESFGGNERYAKDAVYRAYGRLPVSLRSWISRVSVGDPEGGSRLGNRLRNFVRRGSLANPERFYTDDSFASDYFDELLSPDLRQSINENSSLELVQSVYDESEGSDELHRLMYLDLMMAIADNDITKVHRAAKASGIVVAYPYLDPDLVTWMASLPAPWKVKGIRKRYLFKKAVSDLLPPEILAKKKQGFALPIAHWLQGKGPLGEWVNDTLRDQRFRERGFFNNDFIDRLLEQHRRDQWDYSPELWRLFMLENWMREHVDAR